MGILYKTAPGMSAGRSKLAAELSTNEKKQNRCSFNVDIEKKMLDDKPTVVCKMNSYMNYPSALGNSSPLQEEFTDVKAFAQAIYDKIILAGEQL
jgi:hypothetical protein